MQIITSTRTYNVKEEFDTQTKKWTLTTLLSGELPPTEGWEAATLYGIAEEYKDALGNLMDYIREYEIEEGVDDE